MNKTFIISWKSFQKVLCTLLSVVLFCALAALGGCKEQPERSPSPEVTQEEIRDPAGGINTKDDDDDVIVAGTVDTSSNYAFKVEGAFVGMDEYSGDPVVVLVGEFTNNSNKTISYSSALNAVAFQEGRELRTAYLRGASAYSYENIEPGVTNAVLIGWKLTSATDFIEITVTDRYHYAKEVIFKKSYTIDELVANTQKFLDDFSGIVDENQSLSV